MTPGRSQMNGEAFDCFPSAGGFAIIPATSHETNAEHDNLPLEGVNQARKQEALRFVAEQAGRVLHQPPAHWG